MNVISLLLGAALLSNAPQRSMSLQEQCHFPLRNYALNKTPHEDFVNSYENLFSYSPDLDGQQDVCMIPSIFNKEEIKKPPFDSIGNDLFFISQPDGVKKYVFRRPKESFSAFIKQNISDILQNSKSAGKIGIGPTVQFINLEKQFIIEDLLVGKQARDLGANNTQFLDILVDKIFLLHTSNKHEFYKGHTHLNDIDLYQDVIASKDLVLSEQLFHSRKKISYLLKIISQINSYIKIKFYFDFEVPCHNDLHPDNIILIGEDLKLIDWDFSGIGSILRYCFRNESIKF